MKLHVKISLNIQAVFFLGFLDFSRCLQIVSIYDSPNDVSGNRLFQLSGETCCLFTTTISQATVFWHCRCEVLPKICSHHNLKAFR